MATTVLTPTGAQIVDDGDNNWNQLSLAQGLQIFNGFFTTGPSLKIANGGTSRTDGSIPAPGAWFVTANGDITLTPTGGDIILNGLVGINDSSPGAQLDITPTDNSTIGVIIAHPSASTVDAFRMTDGGTTRVVIDNNGQVSMGGITTPQQNLTVGGADGAFALGVMTGTGIPVGESIYQQFQGRPYIGFSASGAARNITGAVELTLAYETGSVGIAGADNEIQILSASDEINFTTASNERMVIDSAGQVGINQGTPTERLHVKLNSNESAWLEYATSGLTAFTRDMPGLQLSAVSMNTSQKYTPAIKFMSNDPQLTTESPKLLALITGESTEAYADDARGGMALIFGVTANNPGTSSIPTERMKLDQDGGLVVGAATGGSKGAGSINIAGDIEKNDSAYTNPDYVFEHWRTGKIEKFADSEGAAEYPGFRSLQEVKAYVQEHYHFPHIGRESMGAFRRGDRILELMEESFIHHFEHDERLTTLEAQMQALIKGNR